MKYFLSLLCCLATTCGSIDTVYTDKKGTTYRFGVDTVADTKQTIDSDGNPNFGPRK